MKITQLLYEEIEHSDVVDAVYDLVFSVMTGDEESISALKMIASQSDEFWSESIDDVTKALNDLEKDAQQEDDLALRADFEEFYDAVNIAVQSVYEKMVDDHNSKGQINVDPDDIDHISISKAFKKVRGFVALERDEQLSKIARQKRWEDDLKKERQDRASAVRKFSDEAMEKVAAEVRQRLTKEFSPKEIKKVIAKPEAYYDWFGFKDRDQAKGLKLSSKEDILARLRKSDAKKYPGYTIMDWLGSGDTWWGDEGSLVMSSPKLMARLVKLVPELA